MLITIRNTRGRTFDIETKPDWTLKELRIAYNERIGATRYLHTFMYGAKQAVSARVLLQSILEPGEILEASVCRHEYQPQPVELIVVFNRNTGAECRIFIYADRGWTVARLKSEILTQAGDDSLKLEDLSLKHNGYKMEDETTLQDCCVNDDALVEGRVRIRIKAFFEELPFFKRFFSKPSAPESIELQLQPTQPEA